MTSEKYDWVGVFTAIEAAMTSAANQRSAEFAASEAERHGLTKQGDANGTYQDKVWERTADGVILRLRLSGIATINPTHTECCRI